MINKRLIRFAGLWLTAVAISLSFVACDSVEAPAEAEVPGDETLMALSEDLAENVPLSAAEQASVNAVFSEHEGRVMEPGFLWYVAAGLQQTLSDEQKERMFRLLERHERRQWQEMRRDGVRDAVRRAFSVGILRPIADDLTEAQRTEIRAIHEEHAEQAKAVFEALNNEEITREEAHEQLASLREELHENVSAVLTEEQREALASWIEERKGEREERREAQREAMIDALDLTTEQVEALDALREQHREELGDWRPGFWSDDFDRSAFLEDRLALHEEMEEALAEILTGAQLEAVKIHRVLIQQVKLRRNRQGGFADGPGFRDGMRNHFQGGMRRGR